jgi:ribulose-5-phosphate 4-epimerase/fuculose-1-phosphate aldolase
MALGLKEKQSTRTTAGREPASQDAVAAARVDLAAALRLAVRFGLNEGIDNHFSLAVPGEANRFLLNPWGLHWSEVRASDLLVVDEGGALVNGPGNPEPTAFYIHSRIHRADKRAACVLHTHMPYATALTSLSGGRMEMVTQNALRFWNEIGYDDGYNGLALDDAEGDRICAALAGRRIVFLANHGVVVTGETVGEAFDDLYFIERACEVQVLAMHTGRPLRQVARDVVEATHRQIEKDRKGAAALHFAALKRILDREGSDYAD